MILSLFRALFRVVRVSSEGRLRIHSLGSRSGFTIRGQVSLKGRAKERQEIKIRQKKKDINRKNIKERKTESQAASKP